MKALPYYPNTARLEFVRSDYQWREPTWREKLRRLWLNWRRPWARASNPWHPSYGSRGGIGWGGDPEIARTFITRWPERERATTPPRRKKPRSMSARAARAYGYRQ